MTINLSINNNDRYLKEMYLNSLSTTGFKLCAAGSIHESFIEVLVEDTLKGLSRGGTSISLKPEQKAAIKRVNYQWNTCCCNFTDWSW